MTMLFFRLCPLVTVKAVVVFIELCVVVQVVSVCEGKSCNSCDYAALILLVVHTVQVSEPWPTPYLVVPQNSTIFMNCTTNVDDPFWTIDLPDEDNTQYRSIDRVFNANGFYELPAVETPEMPTVLRLLINDTSRNNQTRIICSRIFSTKLIVFSEFIR